MIYLFPNGSTFTILMDKSAMPERYHNDLIEVESLPEGEGILRRSEDGMFYYEPYQVVDNPEETIPPEENPQPVETTDQKLERVLQQLDIQRRHNENLTQQNLILLDVNMTIYEELLLMQEGLNNA